MHSIPLWFLQVDAERLETAILLDRLRYGRFSESYKEILKEELCRRGEFMEEYHD